MEKASESMEKLSGKTPSKRKEYESAIDRILELSLAKIENRYTKGNERIAWCRVIVQAVSAGNDILSDHDLEDLKNRIEKLELKQLNQSGGESK